jgi:hypothetical protein
MKPKGNKGSGSKRDSGKFVALPNHIIKCAGFRKIGYASRSLLIDISLQFTGNNNGRLVACSKYLTPLGWNSHATITRSLRELLEAGLLIQTRLGMKPNRAAWFAIPWQQLDESAGLEISNADFLRIKSNWNLKQFVDPLIPKTGVSSSNITP